MVWYWNICPELPKIDPKNEKISNQFNNFCYLRTSFDLKMQDIIQTSNQRDYQKCETKFYEKSISKGNFVNQFNNFCHPNNGSKMVVYCMKFILMLLKKHITEKKLHKKARDTKIIKSFQ